MVENEISALLGDTNSSYSTSITRLSPSSIILSFSGEEKLISILFDIPPRYPSFPPNCTLIKFSNIDDSTLINIRRKLSTVPSRLQEVRSITALSYGITSMIWPQPVHSPLDTLMMPDSLETSRLQVKDELNSALRVAWLKSRSKLTPPNLKGASATDALLIYSLHRASKSTFSIEEASKILSDRHLLSKSSLSSSSVIEIVSELLAPMPPDVTERFLSPSVGQLGTGRLFDDFHAVHMLYPGVIRAYNRVDRRLYIIKCIQNPAFDITSVTRLQYRYIARYFNSWIEPLNQSIAKVFGIDCTDQDCMFIQLENCAGQSLADRMKRIGFFGDDTIQWKVTRQILEAIQYVHSCNSYHGAIRPWNIFVDDSGNSKLMPLNLREDDFCVAQKQTMGNFVQIEASEDEVYKESSTEIENDMNEYKKADMFAFGIIMYEIWYSFASSSERLNILVSRQIPNAFSMAFPLQTRIISLLIQNSNKKPSALELLQSKLLPSLDTGTSVSALIRTITDNEMSLASSAPDVIAALFSESRYLPFKLRDVRTNLKHYRSNLSVRATNLFYHLCYESGATYSPLSIFQKNGGIKMLSRDGSIVSLYTSITPSTEAQFARNRFFIQAVGDRGIREHEALFYITKAPFETAFNDCIRMCVTFFSKFSQGQIQINAEVWGKEYTVIASRILHQYDQQMYSIKHMSGKGNKIFIRVQLDRNEVSHIKANKQIAIWQVFSIPEGLGYTRIALLPFAEKIGTPIEISAWRKMFTYIQLLARHLRGLGYSVRIGENDGIPMVYKVPFLKEEVPIIFSLGSKSLLTLTYPSTDQALREEIKKFCLSDKQRFEIEPEKPQDETPCLYWTKMCQKIDIESETRIIPARFKDSMRETRHISFVSDLFEGILSYLYRMTSLSCDRESPAVLMSNKYPVIGKNTEIGKFHITLPDPSSFLIIDLSGFEVNLTNYSIMMKSGPEGTMKSWVVEGSADCVTWTIIDTKNVSNDTNLRKRLQKEAVPQFFDVKIRSQALFFRYIRLRTSDDNGGDLNVINLSCLELFGTLSCPVI